MAEVIRCRAQLADVACLDGRPLERQFGERDDDEPEHRLADDGTYDGATIVCDPCYIALMPFTPSGQGVMHELPAAISAYRANVEYLRGRDTGELPDALAEARRRAESSTEGSPLNVSANACIHMAQREIERRERLARRAEATE
jgi:hypothetical protein